MILYDNGKWLQTLWTYRGSVWYKVAPPLIRWLVYVFMSWFAIQWLQENIGSISKWNKVFGSSLSFLLVFRANQAYARYLEGRTALTLFFSDIRDFVMFATLHVQGGAATLRPLIGKPNTAHKQDKPLREKEVDEPAHELRVELVRLALALAVCLKIHAKMAHDGYIYGSINGWTKWLIDWDRFRLKQLLNEDEFLWVDSCITIVPCEFHSIGPASVEFEDLFMSNGSLPPGQMPEDWPNEFEVDGKPSARPHTIIVFLLREVLFRNMNDFTNAVPWGIKERFVPRMSKFLETAHGALVDMDKIITTPIPLPYASLFKTLLVLHMLAFPFSVDLDNGVFGSLVAPIVVVVFMLGIDAMASELENPFGNDVNDLDITSLIHELECDAMEMLRLCGDTKGRERFVWRKVPSAFAHDCVMPITQQIAFADCASDEVVQGMSARMPSDLGHSEEVIDYGDDEGSYEDEE